MKSADFQFSNLNMAMNQPTSHVEIESNAPTHQRNSYNPQWHHCEHLYAVEIRKYCGDIMVCISKWSPDQNHFGTIIQKITLDWATQLEIRQQVIVNNWVHSISTKFQPPIRGIRWDPMWYPLIFPINNMGEFRKYQYLIKYCTDFNKNWFVWCWIEKYWDSSPKVLALSTCTSI